MLWVYNKVKNHVYIKGNVIFNTEWGDCDEFLNDIFSRNFLEVGWLGGVRLVLENGEHLSRIPRVKAALVGFSNIGG